MFKWFQILIKNNFESHQSCYDLKHFLEFGSKTRDLYIILYKKCHYVKYL